MDERKPDDARPDALVPANRWEKRKAKIRAEIERNRRGDYKIPTWVLLLVLLAFIGLCAWAAVA